MPAGKCVRKLCIWRTGRSCVCFYMSISCLFSSGMQLGGRWFRNLIDFGVHCSLTVSLILLLLLFVAGERKINKIYKRKLKLGDRLWALEIAYWKLCLYGQLFCIRQTSQFSQFYRVSLAELCALLLNIFEKLNKLITNSEANLRPPQHLNRSF